MPIMGGCSFHTWTADRTPVCRPWLADAITREFILMTNIVPPPQLVLCIPGPWASRPELLAQLLERTAGQYIFAGTVLLHVATKDAFTLEFEARDERMQNAFMSAGPHWRHTPDMERIDDHRSVAYLLSDGGSVQNAGVLMLAAQALLDAGGLGVKVESSGLAHAPDAWRKMCAEIALFSPYRAFVVIVTDQGEGSSCGMHTFGMHDVRVIDDDAANASRVAQAFSWYLFSERPNIREGQTFSRDAQSPAYRISSGDGVDYEDDSLFINPYGTWELQPL